MISAQRVMRGIRRRVTRKPPMHFLRNTKTGSSAMGVALRPMELTGHYHLMLLGRHPRTLSEIAEGEPFFFAVRDTVSRFVSGFYSRQRQGGVGQPRPWRPEEVSVYQRFSTANDLAVALSSPNDDQREAAEAAMGAIRHFRSYWVAFGDAEYFRYRSRDLLMVLFQERLDKDFQILTDLLGVTASLPTDDRRTHRTPPDVDRRLTDVAVKNLRRWYNRDYDFVSLCRSLRPDILSF